MRARGLLMLVAMTAAAAGTGCGNDTGPSTTGVAIPALWLEWPAAVTGAQPGTMRIITAISDCGRHTMSIAVRAQRLEVRNESEAGVVLCRELEVLRLVDTTMALPVLPEPATYQVVAPVRDGWYGGAATRVVGYITAAAVRDTTHVLAGDVVFTPDSIGCTWLYPASRWEETYVVINPPALGTGDYYGGTIAGRMEPMVPARCGQSRGIRLDLVRIDGL